MVKLRAVLGLAVALVTAVGCGVSKDKTAAQGVAEACFESVKRKDFQGVLQCYSPKFFENTSREKWTKMLQNVNAKLGDLQDYEIVGWNFRKFAGLGGGTYLHLQYNVTYSKYPAQEILTLYRPLTGGEFKIVAHGINSPGFLEE